MENIRERYNIVIQSIEGTFEFCDFVKVIQRAKYELHFTKYVRNDPNHFCENLRTTIAFNYSSLQSFETMKQKKSVKKFL